MNLLVGGAVRTGGDGGVADSIPLRCPFAIEGDPEQPDPEGDGKDSVDSRFTGSDRLDKIHLRDSNPCRRLDVSDGIGGRAEKKCRAEDKQDHSEENRSPSDVARILHSTTLRPNRALRFLPETFPLHRPEASFGAERSSSVRAGPQNAVLPPPEICSVESARLSAKSNSRK